MLVYFQSLDLPWQTVSSLVDGGEKTSAIHVLPYLVLHMCVICGASVPVLFTRRVLPFTVQCRWLRH